ncbi:MAG: metallophosphoesterase [Planctomycetota bacterium]
MTRSALAREFGPRATPRRFSPLRLAFFRSVEHVSASLGGRAFYRWWHLRTGRFRMREETIAVRGLPREWHGYTIAQLSDFHGGSFVRAGDLRDVVASVNRIQPDLCVLTGDFVTHRWDESLGVLADCAGLRARDGVFGVFGNHDYRGRLEGRIADAYSARGIRMLRNEGVRIRRGDASLALVGLEDLEEARAIDPDAARAGLSDCDVEILLCHNPSAARALAHERCAVILSGHTHGGQIDLPLLRRLGPPHPGARVRLGATTLVVSRGLGVVGFPLRVGSPAEVVVVRLVRAS